jgi:ribosomal protein S18 acetylase RimI-like enzyme
VEFRGAVFSDINKIMIIIKQAQEYLKQEGIDQWQNNYPNPEIIKNDIENKIGYVLVYNENIIGSVAVSFDGEKTYDYIEGNWLSNNDYAVVHRIAISSEYKGQGFASIMLKNIESMCLKRVYTA